MGPDRTVADRLTPHSTALLAAGLLFAALNLRPAIAAVSPVLGIIRRSTGLSPAAAGTLTTLPLVCFGLLALAVPRLVRRVGAGSLLLGCLIALVVGIVVRSLSSTAALFGGTLVIGVSIGIANVLMPGIVKKDFSQRVGLLTGLYTMMLSAGPALAAGFTVPFDHLLGGNWRLALGFWAIPAALAVVVWLPFRRHGRPSEPQTISVLRTGLWRDPLAWSLTVYMGLQSLIFYTVLAWLPTVLHDRGTSVVAAGAVLALVNVVGIASALITPVLCNRMRDQRAAIVASTAALGIGLAGLQFDPRHLDLVWAVMLGIGQGSAISLALVMMVLRASMASEVNALSGMAQGFGYLIAAAGPAMAGALYSASGGWTAPLAVLLALLLVQLGAGLRAGHGQLRTGLAGLR